MTDSDPPVPTLPTLFARFLTFGLLAWGGPVAQIAMIRRVAVEERHWLSADRFDRLLAVYQILPGPEAHELCVHLGMIQRGRIGGFLAGLGFMLPGLLLMLGMAWSYTSLDLSQPPFAAMLLGVQVGVVALIIHAVYRIGGHVLGNAALWACALASGAATLAGVSFWIVLPAAGLGYWLLATDRRGLTMIVVLVAVVVAVLTHDTAPLPLAGPEVTGGNIGAALLFAAGLKAGLFTFGGAYAAIPFVRDNTVGRGWLGDGQFLDGVALAGVIPSPLIMFATFVGFVAGGLAGALAITAGIFLPAFAMTLLFFDRLERVIDDVRLHRLLEGVAAGVVGMIAATALNIGQTVATSVTAIPSALAIFLLALVILLAWRSRLTVFAVIILSAIAGQLAF